MKTWMLTSAVVLAGLVAVAAPAAAAEMAPVDADATVSSLDAVLQYECPHEPAVTVVVPAEVPHARYAVL